MPPPKYTDQNLILYEDAIMLHIDPTSGMAWFTVSNYAVVFYKALSTRYSAWNNVLKMTIGVPAVTLPNPLPPILPTSKISISSLLDVPDIIKFQVELLKFAGYPNLIKCYVPDAHQMILAAASRAGLHIGMFDWYFPPRAERRNIRSMHFESVRATVYGLKRLLLPRRASWIVRQIREARAQANPLTAFLPHPSFMVEEQRTQFKPGS
jgi:hypothetical protein